MGWEVSCEVVRQGVWQDAGEMRSGSLDGVVLGQEWLWREKCGEGRPRGKGRAPKN